MKPVGLGFIGYGIMGERLLRAAMTHDPATLRVSGVWDPSRSAMERLARDFPDLPRMPSSEALIEASDCVYIASPPSSHLGHARSALKRERALLCEKPLAVDLDDATDFVADAAGAPAAINFPFASSFAVDQLKAWMAEGAVGESRSLEIDVAFATWPRSWQSDAAAWLARPKEGGFTREVVSHFLFLASRLLGPLELLNSSVDYPDAGTSERAIGATLLAGQTPVRLTGQVGDTQEDDRNLWLLEGSAGSIRLRNWSIAERFHDGEWVEAPDALPNETMRPLVLRRQLDKVAAMSCGEAHDLPSPREAFEVQRIVETILAGERT